MDKIDVKSMYQHAREAIAAYIAENPNIGQLPSEARFATMLGVSRNTVREAIRILEREGILYSRHGVGTFITRSGQQMASRITVLGRHSRIIEEHGYTAGTAKISMKVVGADKACAQELLIEPNDEVLCISGIRTADDSPVIYVEDYLVNKYGLEEAYEGFRNESLFDFLLFHFGIKVDYSFCNVKATISDEKVGNMLDLTAPTALLQMEQTHYSAKGQPVLYSKSYFISEKFNFTFVRRPQ